VFKDDLDTHAPLKEKDELYCEEVCEDDGLYFLIYCLKISAIIVVRKHVLRIFRLEFPLREGNLI